MHEQTKSLLYLSAFALVGLVTAIVCGYEYGCATEYSRREREIQEMVIEQYAEAAKHFQENRR
jgi:hypothetical protein